MQNNLSPSPPFGVLAPGEIAETLATAPQSLAESSPLPLRIAPARAGRLQNCSRTRPVRGGGPAAGPPTVDGESSRPPGLWRGPLRDGPGRGACSPGFLARWQSPAGRPPAGPPQVDGRSPPPLRLW